MADFALAVDFAVDFVERFADCSAAVVVADAADCYRFADADCEERTVCRRV